MSLEFDEATHAVLFPPPADAMVRLRTGGRTPAEAVFWAVATHLGVPMATISPRQRLEQDLVIGRLGRVLIALELQALEGRALPLERVWEDVETVQDLIDLVDDARQG